MQHEQQITAVFKALSDITRLSIVKQLSKIDCQVSCGEMSAASPLSQPAMSHHFSKLAEAGVILERKRGKEKYYELNAPLLHMFGIDPSKF